MDMIKQELDRIKDRISDPSFLANKGLSNEVGIHVFCYDSKDEMAVQDYIRRLKAETNTPYRIIECDLYEIFLSLLEDKRILRSVPGLEDKRGKEYLLSQLQKIATPEALLAKIDYSPHVKGQDVLFMTGIGKIHPFMRSHKMLDSMQYLFEDIPIVMFYPGSFNGQTLILPLHAVFCKTVFFAESLFVSSVYKWKKGREQIGESGLPTFVRLMQGHCNGFRYIGLSIQSSVESNHGFLRHAELVAATSPLVLLPAWEWFLLAEVFADNPVEPAKGYLHRSCYLKWHPTSD